MITLLDQSRDQSRYSRQSWIPAVGPHGQDRLTQARVAIIGAGGVKSSLLLYLVAAGVGHLQIVDHDRVELSNLNRQILYRTRDIGAYKAEAAANTLRELNPEIEITATVAHADPNSYDALIGGYDLVFEGGEGAEERRAFNQWALDVNQTYIHASAQYNYAYVQTVVPHVSACFDCSFEDLPASHRGPVPVIGPATGVAGSVAASEAIGILLGMGPSLADRIFFYDGWSNSSMQLENPRRPGCAACGKG